MIQIEPHLLWLGHAGDCRDMAKVLDAGIDAVVQLAAEEPPAQFTREIIVLRIPLLDGADNSPAVLRLAVNSVEQLLASNVRTLLCCSAGMSRSPAIAACALARVEQTDPATSLEAIRTRLATDVSPRLWHDLLATNS